MRGAVIAGGMASRFGGKPKGLERVGGDRILDRVVQALRAAAGEPPLLVANAADASKWRPDLKVTGDLMPHRGSLGGIYSALAAGEGPVLIAAWDMPFLAVELLEALVRGAASYDVFLPESSGPRGMEPLVGVYGPACTEPIRLSLQREDFRAIGFHEAVRVGTLPRDEVARYGDPDVLFFNVNTSEDLSKAEEMWRQHA